MPVGLAIIATSRLLNQCNPSSPRQHSRCNFNCSQLKKWMDDPEFQFGAVFCLFCVSTNSDLLTFEVGCRAQIMALHVLRWSLHGILFRRLMSELSGKLATFSDLTCTMLPLLLERPGRRTYSLFGRSWRLQSLRLALQRPSAKKGAYFQLSEQSSLWSIANLVLF